MASVIFCKKIYSKSLNFFFETSFQKRVQHNCLEYNGREGVKKKRSNAHSVQDSRVLVLKNASEKLAPILALT